jgi:hypothetical protein
VVTKRSCPSDVATYTIMGLSLGLFCPYGRRDALAVLQDRMVSDSFASLYSARTVLRTNGLFCPYGRHLEPAVRVWVLDRMDPWRGGGRLGGSVWTTSWVDRLRQFGRSSRTSVATLRPSLHM